MQIGKMARHHKWDVEIVGKSLKNLTPPKAIACQMLVTVIHRSQIESVPYVSKSAVGWLRLSIEEIHVPALNFFAKLSVSFLCCPVLENWDPCHICLVVHFWIYAITKMPM